MQVLKMIEIYSGNENMHVWSSVLQHILQEGKIHPDSYQVAEIYWIAEDMPDRFEIWQSVIAPCWSWSVWLTWQHDFEHTQILDIPWQKNEKAW